MYRDGLSGIHLCSITHSSSQSLYTKLWLCFKILINLVFGDRSCCYFLRPYLSHCLLTTCHCLTALTRVLCSIPCLLLSGTCDLKIFSLYLYWKKMKMIFSDWSMKSFIYYNHFLNKKKMNRYAILLKRKNKAV